MKSAFTDKKTQPDNTGLKKTIGATFDTWQSVVNFTCQGDPLASGNWDFTGEKYGWSFRIKNSKRILVYMLPRDGFFTFSIIFGQKATNQLLDSNITQDIKTTIQNAKVYAEGRGIRIDVKTKSVLPDLKEMIRIKISN